MRCSPSGSRCEWAIIAATVSKENKHNLYHGNGNGYFPLLFKRVYLKKLVQIASDSIHYWTLLTYFPTYNCSSSIETNRIWQMALFPNSDTGSLAFLARWIQ